jgi:GxxExxY protein
MTENQISEIISGCAIEVHKNLGPGLLENAYEQCLYYEIGSKGLWIEKQKPLPLVYKEIKLEAGYRIDLWVENKLIIEVKSVEFLNEVHLAQVMTYFRVSECKLGLLLNFNVLRLKEGIRRVVNNL